MCLLPHNSCKQGPVVVSQIHKFGATPGSPKAHVESKWSYGLQDTIDPAELIGARGQKSCFFRNLVSFLIFFKNIVFNKTKRFLGNAVVHRRPPDRAVIFCYSMLHSESFPKNKFWHFTTFYDRQLSQFSATPAFPGFLNFW